jgi:hypothetical protein
MESILVFIIGAILLDLAAWRWAADSRDDINSPEWQHRKAWHGR